MASSSETKTIAQALNAVASAGQARAAIGATLIAANKAYPLIDDLPDDYGASQRRQLDQARLSLELYYKSIESVSAQAELRESFATRGRPLVLAVYSVIAAIEGAAHHVPVTSNLAILAASIAEAPGVFGQAVGQAVGGAGQVVGEAAGGILGGLGVSGVVTLAVVGGIILLVLSRGSIVGRVLGGGGG